MEVLITDSYFCKCSLQFDTKYEFDFHLSTAYGQMIDRKQESATFDSVIPQEPETNCEENSRKNETKRRKVSIKATSDHKELKQFKCEICDLDKKVT